MIYETCGAEGFECVSPCADADFDRLWGLGDGVSRAERWTPMRVSRGPGHDASPGHPADFPWTSGGPLVLGVRAVEVLRDLLKPHGELLPLEDTGGVELYALNVTTVLKALDEKRSEIVRFSSGRIMHIQVPVFRPSVVKDVGLFVLPLRASATYVTAPFVERVHAAGLTGLTFRPVST